MIRIAAALCVLGFALPAAAQEPAQPIKAPTDQCYDHVDHEGHGYVDCDDPNCRNAPMCQAMPVSSADDGRLSPKSQIIGGSIMILVGPLLGGGAVPVFLDAASQGAPTQRILEYTVGTVMCAAGVAIAIGGAATLRKGLRRHREDVEMGIAFSPSHLDFRVRF